MPLTDRHIARFKALLGRLELADVEAMTAAKDAAAATPPQAGSNVDASDDAEPDSATIDIEQFAQIDLRVARITSAELVDGADKLLEIRLDTGGTQRTVFSGIRKAYRPEQLVGRHVVLVANLAPRKMRFGVSEGMILAAGGDEGIFLLDVDAGAVAGMKVT